MKTKKGNIEAILRAFSSVRLALFLIIALASASIIGTLIEQNRSVEEYINAYGETLFRVFNFLGFLGLYHSWWFRLLLVLLSLNLLVCSWKRFPKILKVISRPHLDLDEGQMKSLPLSQEFELKASPEEMRDSSISNLKGARVNETKDGYHIYWEKGGYSRTGPYLVHLSLLIILLSALVGSLLGFEAYVNIEEGKSTNVVYLKRVGHPVELPFELRCKKFEVSFYPLSNRPKRFASDLEVIEGGEVVIEKVLEVNHPLSYQGLKFYQASYGQVGGGTFDLELKDHKNETTKPFRVSDNQRIEVPHGYFVIVGFDHNYQLRMGEVGHKNLGPTAWVEFYHEGQFMRRFPIFQNYPEFESHGIEGYSLVLKGYEESRRYYTGIQVTKDPGVAGVWAGSGLMVLGMIFGLYTSHRRIWIKILKGKGKVIFGGATNRDRLNFEKEFSKIINNIQKEISHG